MILSPCPFDAYYLACELCGGGLIFGAFFMATDYVTSPMDQKGQLIYGILLGVLTGLFRFLEQVQKVFLMPLLFLIY